MQTDKNRSAKYRQLAGSPPHTSVHADKQYSHMHCSQSTSHRLHDSPPVICSGSMWINTATAWEFSQKFFKYIHRTVKFIWLIFIYSINNLFKSEIFLSVQSLNELNNCSFIFWVFFPYNLLVIVIHIVIPSLL